MKMRLSKFAPERLSKLGFWAGKPNENKPGVD
jgi:hypothetical protein